MAGACPRHAMQKLDDPNQGMATHIASHGRQPGGWMARVAQGASGGCREQMRGEEGNHRSRRETQGERPWPRH